MNEAELAIRDNFRIILAPGQEVGFSWSANNRTVTIQCNNNTLDLTSADASLIQSIITTIEGEIQLVSPLLGQTDHHGDAA